MRKIVHHQETGNFSNLNSVPEGKLGSSKLSLYEGGAVADGAPAKSYVNE